LGRRRKKIGQGSENDGEKVDKRGPRGQGSNTAMTGKKGRMGGETTTY